MLFAPRKDSLMGGERSLRQYQVGWYGDNGLGEMFIQKILAGRKTATLGPAYDPEERRVGESLHLVDKTGRRRGVIRVTAVEFFQWKDFNETHAARLDLTVEQAKEYLPKYLAREVQADDEMRLTCFELVK